MSRISIYCSDCEAYMYSLLEGSAIPPAPRCSTCADRSRRETRLARPTGHQSLASAIDALSRVPPAPTLEAPKRVRSNWRTVKGSTPFGDKVKTLRMEKGLTLLELGDLIGGHTLVSGYENRGTKPRFHQLIMLAAVLDVSLDELCAAELQEARMKAKCR